ncbi:MAG: hypothetical protein K2Y29_04360 [Beijerinckiaceae bacterium]|nr:hypothetical protein [Beijerinckiaceae bacterium]
MDVETVAEFRGIAIHAFRYKGDDRVFTGVIAQELLANPLHRAAVVEKDGFYAVDYAALGLQVAGADQMMEAAQGAIARSGL